MLLCINRRINDFTHVVLCIIITQKNEHFIGNIFVHYKMFIEHRILFKENLIIFSKSIILIL